MNGFEQTLHVVKKDLRMSRRELGVYLTVLAVSMLIAIGWPTFAEPSLELVSFLLIPLAMVVGASLVQTDSPARMDSFTATKPLSPGWIAAAKIVGTIGVVIVPGLLAQWLVLVWFRVPSQEIPRLLGTTAFALGLFVAAATAVAVFTRDLKTALAALVVTVVSVLVLSQIFTPGGALFLVPVWFQASSWFLPLGVLLAGIGYLYGTRNIARARGIALAAGVLFIALPYLFRADYAREVKRPAHTGDSVAVLDARVDTTGKNARVELDVVVPGARPGDRFDAVLDLPEVVGRGRPDTLRIESTVQTLNKPSMIVGDPSVLWIAAAQTPQDTARIGIVVGRDVARRLLTGGVRLHVAGRISTWRQKDTATLALRRGAAARMTGARFLIDSAGFKNSAWVQMRQASIDFESRNAPGLGRPSLNFALYNPKRHEAIRIGGGYERSSSSMMPLPGISENVARTTMREEDIPRDSGSVTAQWLSESVVRVSDSRFARSDWLDVTVVPHAGKAVGVLLRGSPGMIGREIEMRAISVVGVPR